MKYTFENENALEMWFYITKELGLKIIPPIISEDTYHISEPAMNGILTTLSREFDYDKEKNEFAKKP